MKCLNSYSMRLERLKKFTGCKDKDFLDLVCSLLTFDPSQRLSAKEAIFHPFFNSLFPFTLVFREVASEFKDKRRSFFVSDGDDLRRDIMTSIFDSESKACINDEPEFSDFSDSDTLSETQHIQELPKTQVLFDFNPPKSQSSLEIQRRMRESEGAFVRVNKKARI